jgi:hypothetical protein
MHADEAGQAGQHRADEEADGRAHGEQPPGQQQHDDADDGDGRVLPGQIGLRAFTDGGRDFLHACVALIGREDRLCRPEGVGNGKQAAGYDDVKHGHLPVFSLIFARKNPSPGR